jgi:hypothetical protein
VVAIKSQCGYHLVDLIDEALDRPQRRAAWPVAPATAKLVVEDDWALGGQVSK